jgi:serine/threonine-protein kinase RsbW
VDESVSRRADRLADRLARTQRITSRLATAAGAAEIAAALTESLAADGVGWCGVWLVRQDRLAVVDSPAACAPGLDVRDVPLDGPSPLARVLRNREPLHLPADLDHRPAAERGLIAAGTSAAIVPLLLRDRGLGVLVITYPEEHVFDREETAFLSVMVDQAAQALDRAHLYESQAALARANANFAEAAQVLAEAADFGDTLDRLAGVALVALGDICLIDVLGDHGEINRMVARHRDPVHQSLVDRLKPAHYPGLVGVHPVLEVVRTHQTQWAAEMPDEFLRRTTRDDEHFAVVKALGFRSFLAVPLITGDEIVGSLTLVSASRSFGLDDVHFAERLAQQVAAVVGNARRYDATLRTSHILQQSLLPRDLPRVPGLDIHTRYLPATRGLEVGGDFYDVIVLPSGRIGFMIGDVAGHDRDAAAVMGQLRSAARALAGQVHSPAALIDALQWSWDLVGFDRIATGAFGRLDPGNGDLVMASAGHYPPLVIDGEGARYLPVEPSSPLGAPGPKGADWDGKLTPGQLLLLYTDGVLDERNTGYARAMDRLAAVAAAGDLHPAAVCDRIVAMLPDDRRDDVALLALRMAPRTVAAMADQASASGR